MIISEMFCMTGLCNLASMRRQQIIMLERFVVSTCPFSASVVVPVNGLSINILN